MQLFWLTLLLNLKQLIPMKWHGESINIYSQLPWNAWRPTVNTAESIEKINNKGILETLELIAREQMIVNTFKYSLREIEY